MWTCPKCSRIFNRRGQQHSCKKVPLDQHFAKKAKAKKLFDHLLQDLNTKVGKCQVISIPCCVHLFGRYDFLAALPKKDALEVRFALDRQLKASRISTCVPLSSRSYKNCLTLRSDRDINPQLIHWLKESYHLKD